MRWLKIDKDCELRLNNEELIIEYLNKAKINIEITGDVHIIELAQNAEVIREYNILGNLQLNSFFHNGQYSLFSRLSSMAAITCDGVFLVDRDSILNYETEHLGVKTSSIFKQLSLIRSASKTSKLSVRLEKGAKGSIAKEYEKVILLDNAAHNISIPAIYCAEKDMHGEHAISCGHIIPDVATYLESRGLNRREIQQMLIYSSIKDIKSRVNSKEALKYINNMVDKYV